MIWEEQLVGQKGTWAQGNKDVSRGHKQLTRCKETDEAGEGICRQAIHLHLASGEVNQLRSHPISARLSVAHPAHYRSGS